MGIPIIFPEIVVWFTTSAYLTLGAQLVTINETEPLAAGEKNLQQLNLLP